MNPKKLLSWLRHLVYLFVSMCGFRPDRLTWSWILGGAASLALGELVARRAPWWGIVGYFIATWLFYYVGNTWIVRSRRRETLIRRFGAEGAYARYEILCAMMFIGNGLGIGALVSLPGQFSSFGIPSELLWLCGAPLFALGLTMKIWATHLVGIETYYFKDLFLDQPSGQHVTTGPYRCFKNPMYGIGQLHAYGFAIVADSIPALLGVVVCHLGIYGFYFVAERPFVARVYGTLGQPVTTE